MRFIRGILSAGRLLAEYHKNYLQKGEWYEKAWS
jgi:hypothetical protein